MGEWEDWEDDVGDEMWYAAAAGLISIWLGVRFFNRPRSWALSRNDLCADNSFADSTSFFSSSMSRFNFARRFWNHVITCKKSIQTTVNLNEYAYIRTQIAIMNIFYSTLITTAQIICNDSLSPMILALSLIFIRFHMPNILSKPTYERVCSW